MLDFWNKINICIAYIIIIPIVFVVVTILVTLVLMGIKAVLC